MNSDVSLRYIIGKYKRKIQELEDENIYLKLENKRLKKTNGCLYNNINKRRK